LRADAFLRKPGLRLRTFVNELQQRFRDCFEIALDDSFARLQVDLIHAVFPLDDPRRLELPAPAENTDQSVGRFRSYDFEICNTSAE
jgi:hypothetical protein